MVPKSKQIALWIAWVCIWPASLTLIYFQWPHQFGDDQLAILSFGLIMCIVAFFPLIVNKTPIFFVHGIGFAVFLNYGLFVEILLTQFAILVVLYRVRVGRKDLYRIPLNMLMFLFVSIMSAYVYLLLGGRIGSIYLLRLDELIPIAGYVLTVFISNHILLYAFRRVIFEQKPKLVDKSLWWEFITTIVVLPVGFVLYMMYQDFGIFGIYFVGLPFISISIILMLYHSSNSINYYLQQTSEIGHQLTAELEVNEVIDLFVERVTKLLPVDYTFVYDVVDDDHLQLIRFYDVEQKLDFPEKDQLKKNESISGTAWATNKVVNYHTKKDWKHLKDVYLPLQGESVISFPIERKNKTVAVITLLSQQKRAFEKSQYMILDILKNHFAVALENAKNYEKTKNQSERDQLTDLYNYRFFEDYLEKYFYDMKQAKRTETISLILLDLDRFKSINDTYGHQSGNEILKGLAQLLQQVVCDKGVLARFGGEEFVILLPGYNQLQTLILAETIRNAIERETFTLTQHILEDDCPIEIHVTASIGVATYPDNCEDPYDLIRHADRAMYVGAKQRGRNKVAVYEN
ncbi:sensor domain-containing diguanylate cyclase [Aquibacillus koreensis]|uniref:Sensor domain-containing diguanylate cyclase n=1 Tax=Aquibacillus koreensis TaxID=279446 RepID=A0A9X4AGZ2_9BACI|nr:sensor domain-containing diguanylate cyclase [Aquibacillus koreensis]MCT2537940.1 sensor domain-containing diguanylate cyclase [Aquibacillus koreensis]MDC3419169.1 sensor domain-containing diguanylate cyclase [Aquibacillus koreensis]